MIPLSPTPRRHLAAQHLLWQRTLPQRILSPAACQRQRQRPDADVDAIRRAEPRQSEYFLGHSCKRRRRHSTRRNDYLYADHGLCRFGQLHHQVSDGIATAAQTISVTVKSTDASLTALRGRVTVRRAPRAAWMRPAQLRGKSMWKTRNPRLRLRTLPRPQVLRHNCI